MSQPRLEDAQASPEVDGDARGVQAGGGGGKSGAVVGGQWGSLGRLAVVVVGGVVAAFVTHATAWLVVVLAIVAMIMLHELGHFVTAKWGGMKVTEYFLGFGPRLWSVRRGETEYGVKAIPAGGYVKILGMSNLEQVDPADEPRTYRQAPFWRRLSVAVAGSVVHFLLAFVLLWSIFALAGTASTTEVSIGGLSQFAHGPSPAQRAGFRPGDIFVSMDGHRFTDPNKLAAFIQSNAGRPLQVVVDRHGHHVALHVTPVPASHVRLAGGAALAVPPGRSSGIIGVQLSSPMVRANPVLALGSAGSQLASLTTATVTGIGHLFSPHGLATYAHQVVGAPSPPGPGAGAGHASSAGSSSASANQDRITSIVGAARIATQAAHAGVGPLLLVLAAINVFVGLFNMIPLLPLDGGHVVIAVYERIRSRRGRRYRADVAKLLPATYLVFLFLVVLGASALYLDIAHPIANPFH